MSIQFNDTTNYKGLVQLYEKEIAAPRGFISGNEDRLKEFTAEVNIAVDDFFSIAIPASGKWQLDDSNHTTKFPIIKTNIVSGTRDYSWTVDELSNLVLDIYKVAILKSSTATIPQEINPIDINDAEWTAQLLDEVTTGIPSGYDKLANAIRFDVIPNYSATNGLLMYINREGSYFTYQDTTKKPGVPGLLHPYFYLKPARNYARQNTSEKLPRLEKAVFEYEGDEDQGVIGKIARQFGRRERDIRNIMTGKKIKYI